MKFLAKLRAKCAVKAYAMSRSIADDPLQKFKFRVTVSGMPSGAGFQKVGGLSNEVDVIEYVEGLYDHTHKLPGREKVGEVTLERGSFTSTEFRDIFQNSLTNPSMRQTVIIEIMNRYSETKRTYKLAEAWVSKWEGSDLDAGSSDVAVEKMTIQFEYFL